MLGNKSEYFLKVLLDLAARRRDEYVTSREIAERQGIPPKYIPQIVSELTKTNWVDSSRGPKGGVRLNVDPAEISVAAVIDLAEGGFALKTCLLADPPCPLTADCPLYPVWREAQAAVRKVFERYTIADLINPEVRSKTKKASRAE